VSRYVWITGEQVDAVKAAQCDADLRQPSDYGSSDKGTRERNQRDRDHRVDRQKQRLESIVTAFESTKSSETKP
jgi:hypothetical protein